MARIHIALLALAITAGCDKNDHYCSVCDKSSSSAHRHTSDGSVATIRHSHSATREQNITRDDAGFVRDAAMANLAEIELGRIALSKAENQEVRNYGQQMIDDHSNAQADLRSVAESAGFVVPNDLDAQHRDMVDRHERQSGMEFDRAYMDMMVNDHQKVISKFEDASTSADNPQLRDFAGRMLPKLRQHLANAEDILSRL